MFCVLKIIICSYKDCFFVDCSCKVKCVSKAKFWFFSLILFLSDPALRQILVESCSNAAFDLIISRGCLISFPDLVNLSASSAIARKDVPISAFSIMGCTFFPNLVPLKYSIQAEVSITYLSVI